MAVWAGAISCTAHEGDGGALLYLLARGDEEGGVVAVAGDHAAFVFDFHQVPVAVHPGGLGDDAGGGGGDGDAVVRRDVDAFMVGGTDAAGAFAEAVGTGNRSSHRPDVRRGAAGFEEAAGNLVGVTQKLVAQSHHNFDLAVQLRIQLADGFQKLAGIFQVLCRFGLLVILRRHALRLIRHRGGAALSATGARAHHRRRLASLHHVLQLA